MFGLDTCTKLLYNNSFIYMLGNLGLGVRSILYAESNDITKWTNFQLINIDNYNIERR